MAKRQPPTVPRRRSRKADREHPVYELDIWLIGSDPPIWRSVVVPAGFTLYDLHVVIQCVMPWDNSHLHAFETRQRKRFSDPPPDDLDLAFPFEDENENEVLLAEVYDALCETLVYEYDFGDSWEHGIKLIKTHEDAAAFDRLPALLGGERAAPPDDSGGLWGYYDMLDILKAPDSEDDWHRQVLEWMDEGFDPAAFDVDAANALLAEAFPPPRKRG